MEATVTELMRESAALKEKCAPILAPVIAGIARAAVTCLRAKGKILLFGNGGSASDAQHIAAEFVNRFERNRPGLASIALTTDTSILTSVGNDASFEEIFSRQVEALCRPEDLVLGISTSGTSPNVLRGIRAAKLLGAKTVGLSGRDGGELAKIVDLSLVVPHKNTARIQEVHITAMHIVCHLVDVELYGSVG